MTANRSGKPTEVRVLALPVGPAGTQVRALAEKALPELELDEAVSDDDLIIYREVPNLPLSELDQLGPLAYESYRHMSSAQHMTPHSRCDITEWRVVNAQHEDKVTG